MEKLRPAVKNGNDIIAECPIHALCESLPDEDGGTGYVCGHLKGYYRDRRGMKARCKYFESN